MIRELLGFKRWNLCSLLDAPDKSGIVPALLQSAILRFGVLARKKAIQLCTFLLLPLWLWWHLLWILYGLVVMPKLCVFTVGIPNL